MKQPLIPLIVLTLLSLTACSGNDDSHPDRATPAQPRSLTVTPVLGKVTNADVTVENLDKSFSAVANTSSAGSVSFNIPEQVQTVIISVKGNPSSRYAEAANNLQPEPLPPETTLRAAVVLSDERHQDIAVTALTEAAVSYAQKQGISSQTINASNLLVGATFGIPDILRLPAVLQSPHDYLGLPDDDANIDASRYGLLLATLGRVATGQSGDGAQASLKLARQLALDFEDGRLDQNGEAYDANTLQPKINQALNTLPVSNPLKAEYAIATGDNSDARQLAQSAWPYRYRHLPAQIRHIAVFGDSLTRGAGSSGVYGPYPAQLALLSGWKVSNKGFGGQNSDMIAARLGSKPLALTVTGNQIPAHDSVRIETLSTNLFQNNGALSGTLDGIDGTLTLTNGTYWFSRKSDGPAVAVAPDTPFIPADPDVADCDLVVLWAGRTDFGATDDTIVLRNSADRIFNRIEASVRMLLALNKRVIILGVSASDKPNEYIGTYKYSIRRSLTERLAQRFPRSFIDIDLILNRSGSGQGQDQTDQQHGVIPSSLRYDPTHLNNAGYGIVARAVYNRIRANRW